MTINWRRVARDTLIVWLATVLGGLAVGFSFGLLGATQSPKLGVAIAFTNMVFGIVAFAIVGLLTRADRLRHLSVVVLASWLVNLLNVPLFGFTIGQWALSLPFLAVFMLIGCAIAWLISRFNRERAA